MSECVFCRIVAGEIPSDIIYEDDTVLAFKDINPQAPVHLLLIPKDHIPSLLELTEADRGLLAHIFAVIQQLAREYELDKKGFRTVINTGDEGGQTVHHLHFHLLGGRFMQWPPG
ncbi:MAG TPA: histidine triad nucleotide-binding protein [Firmicutes bacterium]|nr:histidine triad nucleotide-binding protein [Bacillota bacterium]